MESDTPRTDAENCIRDMGFEKWVSIDFARELERELAAAKDELSKKVGELAAMQKQRDEARRDACAFEAINRWIEAHPKGIMSPCAVERIAREIAVERVWNCFKEGGGA